MMQKTEELHGRLEQIAYKVSTKFCYSCYQTVKTKYCPSCGSDDLMRQFEDSGPEWGVNHIIDQIIGQLEPIDTDEEFEQWMNDVYSENILICGQEFDPVRSLKELSPGTWDAWQSDWESERNDEEEFITFDNGTTYYKHDDIETLVNELEGGLEDDENDKIA